MIEQPKSGRVIVNGREPRGRRLTALFVAVLLTSGAHAQAPTAAQIAAYTGSDRAQRLIEGAKKEGTLTVYSSLTLPDMNAIIGPFERKYGIKVQLWRGSSEAIRYRAITESRNG